jgi:hypothetical protein
MKKQIINLFCAAALLAVFLPAALPAADFQVIASKDVAADEISAADLSRIYLLSKTSLPGTGHIAPVLQKGGPATQAFLKECVGKSEAELQDAYKELVFTGKANEPKVLASDAAVIAYVSMSRGVIAYVSASAIPMGVKKLAVK